MKLLNKQKNKGFTLIETMIAVFILAIAMNAMFGVIARSLYSARYAKNDIIADYLLQEAVDYIRNDRDTSVFQQGVPGTIWARKYISANCFTNGCEIEPAVGSIKACNTAPNSPAGGYFGTLPCRTFRYDETGNNFNKDFYTYSPGVGVASNFKRQIIMSVDNPISNANKLNPAQLDIKVTVEWKNGTLTKSRTLRTSLLKWQ